MFIIKFIQTTSRKQIFFFSIKNSYSFELFIIAEQTRTTCYFFWKTITLHYQSTTIPNIFPEECFSFPLSHEIIPGTPDTGETVSSPCNTTWTCITRALMCDYINNARTKMKTTTMSMTTTKTTMRDKAFL